jgi:hypothetical protein
MAADSASELRFQIGHVLFIDIVGYSKLLINEQSEQMQKLREIQREHAFTGKLSKRKAKFIAKTPLESDL